MSKLNGVIQMCMNDERVSCVIKCTQGNEKTFITNAILSLYERLPLEKRGEVVDKMIQVEIEELQEM